VQDGDTVPVPEGGDFLLEVHLFEFRFPVYRMIGGALFIDAGNVWRSVNQVRLRDLRWGAGAGIRVNIPFGVIRFDAGMRLNDNPAYAEEPFGAVHLDIGQAF